MVWMEYEIKCDCGAYVTDSVSSGDSDKYLSDFKCSHFKCTRYQETKLGWLFGANARVKIAFKIECKNCHSSKSSAHQYWGYSDSSESTSKNCCGHKLSFWSKSH